MTRTHTLPLEAVDVVQPDLCTVGGILEGYKIATMAEAFMVSIAPHNPLSPLSTVIALHLDTVVPNFLIQETSRSPERDKILNQRVEEVQDGYLVAPTGPGWGEPVSYVGLSRKAATFADSGAVEVLPKPINVGLLMATITRHST